LAQEPHISSEPSKARILVIKLSALGDFVLSISAFQAIRRHHADAEITLLTTKPFAQLARASGCFDHVLLDQRAPWWRPDVWLALALRLRKGLYWRVYDLQRSQRSAVYLKLFGSNKKPQWVGPAAGASHQFFPPADQVLHIADREAAQLALAGVPRPRPPDLSFLRAELTRFDLPEAFALMVPGGAAHRPEKRWPAHHYAKIATLLAGKGITPLLLGGDAEAAELAEIVRLCPTARNLCGETSLEDLAALARGARLALGNDTGPMHLIAAAGARCLVLFSGASNPLKVAPRGPAEVRTLQRGDLAALSFAEVAAELAWLLGERDAPPQTAAKTAS
jgi:ADP-heptose:LPS heptosyltransferase